MAAKLADELAAARDRVARLSSALNQARANLTVSVRRLQRTGAPPAAIAAALGLSEAAVTALLNPSPDHLQLVCSFCGDPGRLVAGPSVYICWDCIIRARAIGNGHPTDRTVNMHLAAPERPCTFCGLGAENGRFVAEAAGFRICRECLDLCEEIVAEDVTG